MRKKITDIEDKTKSTPEWLDLEQIAMIEVTSEDPNFPIESALAPGAGPGWRAAKPGQQILRVVFDEPMALHQIQLEFVDLESERTQELLLRWSMNRMGPFREIVRQQWNFSPHGSTHEVEHYQVDLRDVAVLELVLTPDLARKEAVATLAAFHIN